MRQLDELIMHQGDIIELSRIKTRPPVMRDLLPPSISQSTIYAVYRSVNKAGPPRGQLPQEIRVFFANPKRRLHASAILNIWERFKDLPEPTKAKRYIKTYHMYINACDSNELIYDFNRLWFLIRQYEMRRVGMRVCSGCGQRYAYNREDISDVHNCHGCALLEQETHTKTVAKKYG